MSQDRVQIVEDAGRAVTTLMSSPWLLLIVDQQATTEVQDAAALIPPGATAA